MSILDRINLGYGFRKYFRIDAAHDEALRDQVYRIRHEVYCEELQFEPERPDRREIDAYDAHSLHCLLRGVDEPHTLVGCTRLVLVNPDEPDAPLPFERTCAATLDRSIIDPAKMPRGRIAEVSRLAVCARYRRRKGEARKPADIQDEDFGSKGQPRFPYIPVGLYMGAISLAIRHDIDTLFVLTEPRLASHFARLGVDIRQIGGPIEHRGTRVPSVMDVQSIVRNMRMIMRPLWRTIDEGIALSLEQR
ncbi:PEP-CTERM/exosortase system-associated acyltransferase [Thauera sp. SDU_THAU2]|uniref:PEP-CTERM/exosortase system-associated acyltransferase n=1 Tax=Thauera sp. SDU_THAU2 TaxID=3136633 RepID=UPI00311D548E